MENYFNEVREFATTFLAANDNDAEKATENLSKMRGLLCENPQLIPTISDPQNQKVLIELVELFKDVEAKGKNKKPGVLAIAEKLGKAMEIAKKFKFK